jgi:hypothetical protein
MTGTTPCHHSVGFLIPARKVPRRELSIAQLRAQVILMSRQCPAGPVAGGPVFESHTTSPRVSPYMVWLCPAATVNVFVPLDVAIVNQHFGLVPMGQEKTALQSRPGKFASAKAPVTGKHPVNNASEIVTTYPLRHETACTTFLHNTRVQTFSRELWLDRDGWRPRHAKQTTRRSNGFCPGIVPSSTLRRSAPRHAKAAPRAQQGLSLSALCRSE